MGTQKTVIQAATKEEYDVETNQAKKTHEDKKWQWQRVGVRSKWEYIELSAESGYLRSHFEDCKRKMCWLMVYMVPLVNL